MSIVTVVKIQPFLSDYSLHLIIMNFSNITTPADLQKHNDPASHMLELLKECSYEETLNLTRNIVKHLADYHQHMVNVGLEEDNDINPLGWACDHGKLISALSILSEVE